MVEKVIDIGNTVICDSCNKDFTNLEDTGGILFGTYAYCPDCTPRMLRSIKKYGEQRYIKARCPEGMQYRHWILQLRGGNNRIVVQSNSEEGADELMNIIKSNPAIPEDVK